MEENGKNTQTNLYSSGCKSVTIWSQKCFSIQCYERFDSDLSLWTNRTTRGKMPLSAHILNCILFVTKVFLKSTALAHAEELIHLNSA